MSDVQSEVSDVQSEMDRANDVWRRHVEPILSDLVGKPSRWVSTEDADGDEVHRLLDRDHVTDGFLIVNGRSYMAAKRVQFAKPQWPESWFPTITVRVDRLDGGRTEIEKIGELGPKHLHIQAYMDATGSKLLAAYMALSVKLPSRIKHDDLKDNSYDGTIFGYANFHDLRGLPFSRSWVNPSVVARAL